MYVLAVYDNVKAKTIYRGYYDRADDVLAALVDYLSSRYKICVYMKDGDVQLSCYHPFLGLPDYEADLSSTGKYRYKILSNFDPIALVDEPLAIKVPCGKCLGCRLDYSRQWADRMMLELQHTGKAIFVTLTYNNENIPTVVDDFDLPVAYTLDKDDWQRFMKRLRARSKFVGRELRFYACGEYGSHTRRPHMHAIIFGLSLEDFPDRKVKGYNELRQTYYVSKEFEGIWQKGFTLITDVSWQTCAYVSRYVMKKAFADDIGYAQLPEFSLMSRRPGIGAYYLADHPDVFEKDSIYLSSSAGSVKVRVPKYFLNKLKERDPDSYDSIMREKKEFMHDRDFLKMQQTDLSYVEQLELEEERLLDKVDILSKIRL